MQRKISWDGRRTDRQTKGRTEVKQYTPPPVEQGYNVKQKMEECVHRTHVSFLFFSQSKGHNPKTQKKRQSEIKLDLPYMVPDLVYKFQICIRETT